MGSVLYHVAATAALPPLNGLLLLGLGWWLRRWRPAAGRACIGVGLALLYLLATPIVGSALRWAIEPPYADPLLARPQADAVVILGGGARRFAVERMGPVVKDITLRRLQYGAWLHRRTGKPILVSGGRADPESPVEAQVMRQTLTEELRVPVRWAEDLSVNTFENAVETRRILAAHGIRRIYLVTHAVHLPRAQAVFERAGLEVIPAGTDFAVPDPGDVLSYLPSIHGLADAHYACYEAIGRVWYMLRSRI